MMKEGGERITQEGSGTTGWEEVAELASQAPESDQELGIDTGVVDLSEKVGKMLRREVFEKVNLHRVERVVNKALEKVDGEILLELQGKLDGNIEDGVRLASEYYASILKIEGIPPISEGKLADGTLAQCLVSLNTERGARIVYDKNNIDKFGGMLLLSLGHEFWHAWQNQEMRKNTTEGGTWDGTLYLYNYNNYMEPEDDYVAYRNQLVEMEAFEFEKGIEQKIIDAKLGQFIKSHPEIYSIENMAGIEKEMQGMFRGFNVDNFLERVGVSTVEEFFEKITHGEDKVGVEELAGRYMEYLTDLVGMKREMKVRLDDLGKAGLKAILDDNVGVDEMEISSDMLVIRDEVLLDRNGNDYSDVFLRTIPRLAWRLHQNELVKDASDNERAQLYAMNKANFVTKKYDYNLADSQLLTKEQNEFANTLMGILDEQTMVEEVEKMPLSKRVLAKLQMVRKSALPLSKKYQVRRNK